MADATLGDSFRMVGHVGHRWCGAPGIVRGQAALLPCVPSADRPAADIRVFRNRGRPGVLRLLRGALIRYGPILTLDDSAGAARRARGIAVHSREEQGSDPPVGERGVLRRADDFAPPGEAVSSGAAG